MSAVTSFHNTEYKNTLLWYIRPVTMTFILIWPCIHPNIHRTLVDNWLSLFNHANLPTQRLHSYLYISVLTINVRTSTLRSYNKNRRHIYFTWIKFNSNQPHARLVSERTMMWVYASLMRKQLSITINIYIRPLNSVQNKLRSILHEP